MENNTKTLQIEKEELKLLIRLITLNTRYNALYRSASNLGYRSMALNYAKQTELMYDIFIKFSRELESKYNINLNIKSGISFDIDNSRIIYYEES